MNNVFDFGLFIAQQDGSEYRYYGWIEMQGPAFDQIATPQGDVGSFIYSSNNGGSGSSSGSSSGSTGGQDDGYSVCNLYNPLDLWS